MKCIALTTFAVQFSYLLILLKQVSCLAENFLSGSPTQILKQILSKSNIFLINKS